MSLPGQKNRLRRGINTKDKCAVVAENKFCKNDRKDFVTHFAHYGPWRNRRHGFLDEFTATTANGALGMRSECSSFVLIEFNFTLS